MVSRLNIDLGERSNEPEDLYELAHIANVACGGHAGDEASMLRAIALCRRFGTLIGAHPSYPDRERFGRATMAATKAQVRDWVAEQCSALSALARRSASSAGSPANARVTHVKLHGALYHDANANADLADACLTGARAALGDDLTWIGAGDGALEATCRVARVRFAREGFADRRYRVIDDALRLVSRTESDALLQTAELAAAQALWLVKTQRIDTVCVHGDTPGAPQIARAVRRALDGLAVEAGQALGDRAFRLPRPSATDPATLRDVLLAQPHVIDVVVAEEHVAVYFDRPQPSSPFGSPRIDLAGLLESRQKPSRASREVPVSVRYDGPDVADVATRCGLTRDAVIELHSAQPYTVKVVGFLPGFAYLGDVDARLRIARRADPRPRVPANAVAIAEHYTGIYPFASAGGWHLIGTAVDFVAFRPDSGAALQVGDRVRFSPVSS